MKKILIVIGTRPEAIKLAPVVWALRARPGVQVSVCLTNQHTDLLASVADFLDLQVEIELSAAQAGRGLGELTAHLTKELTSVLTQGWDWVVVQGDTTSAFVGGLTGFYQGAKVAHVEAGLRTGDRHAPWPEEVNRRMLAPLTDLHLAPTERAAQALRAEGIAEGMIQVVGNTVVDTLQAAVQKVGNTQPPQGPLADSGYLKKEKAMVLVTGHRRENLDGGITSVCQALVEIVKETGCEVVFPVHLNPKVKDAVEEVLAQVEGVYLLPPLDYLSFVWLMNQADVILSDSGGVQEEAPGLGVPVVVTREVTERQEAVEGGFARLVGTEQEKIVNEVCSLLKLPAEERCPPPRENPFGDGKSGSRIAELLIEDC